MADKPTEFLTRNANPISCIIGGQIDQLNERRIENQFSHSNEPQYRDGKSGNIDSSEIANRAKFLVEDLDDSRAFHSIPVNCLMNRLPDQ